MTVIATLLALVTCVGIFYLGYKVGSKQPHTNTPKTELTEKEKLSMREGERLNKYLNSVLNYKA